MKPSLLVFHFLSKIISVITWLIVDELSQSSSIKPITLGKNDFQTFSETNDYDTVNLFPLTSSLNHDLLLMKSTAKFHNSIHRRASKAEKIMFKDSKCNAEVSIQEAPGSAVTHKRCFWLEHWPEAGRELALPRLWGSLVYNRWQQVQSW